MTYTWREELAWAAGFWDGEGCTTIKSRKPHAELSQVDDELEALHRFQNAILGVGKIYGPYKNKGDNRRPYHQWCVHGGSKVQAVIAMLWPFLGDIKREQAARVLTTAKWQGEGMCRKNKHLINPEWSQPSRTTRVSRKYKCEGCYREQYKRENDRRSMRRIARVAVA